MARYDFYQDRKYTVWERTLFTVEARSREEAIAKAGSIIQNDVHTVDDETICVGNAEILYDTLEDLSVEDNGGNATREIYMVAPHQDALLADNADEVVAAAS